MILVGDVGGTKTLLEIGILQGGRWQPAHGGRYAAADYPDMDGLLRNFLGEWKSLNHSHGTILHACLGVAGPVLDDCAQMTNLPWTVDGKAISASFGIPRVQVVNDFAAAASGIELLLKSDVIVLQTGEPMHGAPRLVIGAGTGLGVAQLVWTGAGY